MPKLPRYAEVRKYIRWGASDELKCLKMMAHVLYTNEAICRNKIQLWNRVEEVCPVVLDAVLSNRLSFKELRRLTFDSQGIKITPERIYQRADKTGRYSEFNGHLVAVKTAYTVLVLREEDPATLRIDPRRSFSDDIVRAALREQEYKCYYCSRECDGVVVTVVGDHRFPHSRGGKTELYNCAAACVRCNQEKGDMTEFEYGKLVAARDQRGRKIC